MRQAAYRLASTLASSASAGNRAAATSAGGLLASRTRLAATAGPEAGCVAACEALKERAPQRPPGGGGEAGGALPVWAAMLEGWRSAPLGHATTPLLAENGYHEVLRQVRSTFLGVALSSLSQHPPRLAVSHSGRIRHPLQLGPEGLRPLPAGEVRVHWVLPNGSADESEKLMFEAPFRQAVEDSVQAVGKALRQEAESTDSGKRELVSEPLRGCGAVALSPCCFFVSGFAAKRLTNLLRSYIQRLMRLALHSVRTPAQHLSLQKHGVHVIVVPREARPARLTACDAAIIPASTLRACLAPNPGGKHRDYPAAVAALQYVLAHEIAHIYLDHAVSKLCFCTAVLTLRHILVILSGCRSACLHSDLAPQPSFPHPAWV